MGVSVHFQHIFDNEMNTDSWVMKNVLYKVVENFLIFCQYISAPPYFFFNFLKKKTLQRMKKIYQNLQCDEKRLRNLYSHYNDSHYYSPPPLVFLFCKIDEITKLDDEQKNLL